MPDADPTSSKAVTPAQAGVQKNFIRTRSLPPKEWVPPRKGALQLGLRLPSRNARTRGRLYGRKIFRPYIRALKQRADRNPRAHASLGIVATGFKTPKPTNQKSKTGGPHVRKVLSCRPPIRSLFN